MVKNLHVATVIQKLLKSDRPSIINCKKMDLIGINTQPKAIANSHSLIWW
jgi:hypothetical protein